MFYPGLTPARAAANRGHAAVLHALICGGIPVDVPAHDGTTPVFGAIQSPPHLALPTVSLLLEGGAVDSNHCAQHGDTPIFHAARCGRPDIILKLYEHGALIDCSTHHVRVLILPTLLFSGSGRHLLPLSGCLLVSYCNNIN